jgi:hypothetical protein
MVCEPDPAETDSQELKKGTKEKHRDIHSESTTRVECELQYNIGQKPAS